MSLLLCDRLVRSPNVCRAGEHASLIFHHGLRRPVAVGRGLMPRSLLGLAVRHRMREGPGALDMLPSLVPTLEFFVPVTVRMFFFCHVCYRLTHSRPVSPAEISSTRVNST